MFKKGDRVKHKPSGYCGSVDEIYVDSAGTTILVDWDNGDLLPCKLPIGEFEAEGKLKAKMFVGDTLVAEFDEVDYTINPDSVCPACGTPWTETYIFGEPKYDCVPCGKKKEDLDLPSLAQAYPGEYKGEVELDLLDFMGIDLDDDGKTD